MAVDLTRIGDGIVKCLTMTLGKPSMDKEMVMAAQEIGTEGLYRNRAYGWRATNERKGVTKDCVRTVHNGSSWQAQRRVAEDQKIGSSGHFRFPFAITPLHRSVLTRIFLPRWVCVVFFSI